MALSSLHPLILAARALRAEVLAQLWIRLQQSLMPASPRRAGAL